MLPQWRYYLGYQMFQPVNVVVATGMQPSGWEDLLPEHVSRGWDVEKYQRVNPATERSVTTFLSACISRANSSTLQWPLSSSTAGRTSSLGRADWEVGKGKAAGIGFTPQATTAWIGLQQSIYSRPNMQEGRQVIKGMELGLAEITLIKRLNLQYLC